MREMRDSKRWCEAGDAADDAEERKEAPGMLKKRTGTDDAEERKETPMKKKGMPIAGECEAFHIRLSPLRRFWRNEPQVKICTFTRGASLHSREPRGRETLGNGHQCTVIKLELHM